MKTKMFVSLVLVFLTIVCGIKYILSFDWTNNWYWFAGVFVAGILVSIYAFKTGDLSGKVVRISQWALTVALVALNPLWGSAWTLSSIVFAWFWYGSLSAVFSPPQMPDLKALIQECRTLEEEMRKREIEAPAEPCPNCGATDGHGCPVCDW